MRRPEKYCYHSLTEMASSFFSGFTRLASLSWAALAVYLALLAMRLFPLSSSSERVAPYLRAFSPWFLFFGVAAAFVICAALRRYSWEKNNGLAALTAWLAAALLLHSFLCWTAVFPLPELVLSPTANSFYAASALPPSEVLSRFKELPALFPAAQHMHTNMAGKPLLYSLLAAAGGQGAFFMAVTLIVLGKLAALPIYFLVVALSEDRRKALLSAVFYLFAPMLFYFSPMLNTVTPLFLLSAMLAVVYCLRTGLMRYAPLAGALFYLLLLFEPAPGAVLCLFTALALVYYGKLYADTALRRSAAALALAAVGFAAVYALLSVCFGYSLWDNMRQSYVYAQVPFYKREYWRWFAMNPFLFLINCGVGLALAAVASGWAAPRRFLKGGEPLFLEASFALVLLVSLAFFNFLGLVGAEASRLWLYLAPLAAVLAASYCVEKQSLHIAWAVLGVAVVQTAATLPVAGFVVP